MPTAFELLQRDILIAQGVAPAPDVYRLVQLAAIAPEHYLPHPYGA